MRHDTGHPMLTTERRALHRSTWLGVSSMKTGRVTLAYAVKSSQVGHIEPAMAALPPSRTPERGAANKSSDGRILLNYRTPGVSGRTGYLDGDRQLVVV